MDVRIIAATNKDLGLAVRERHFREDLFFRLNVFPISLPALRERPEDIPLLAMSIVDELGASMGRHFDAIAQPSMLALRHYQWPGNIRELRNVIERAMITSDGPALNIDLPRAQVRRTGAAPLSLKAVERKHVFDVLCADRVEGPRPPGRCGRLGAAPNDTREPDETAGDHPAIQQTPMMGETPKYGRTLRFSAAMSARQIVPANFCLISSYHDSPTLYSC